MGPASVNTLMSAVAQQPVSIGIEADQAVFQHYTGGIISGGKCGHMVDHGVLLVGYGHDESLGMDYWKVKNSWGASWGDHGYVRIVRGANEWGGECFIRSSPSYPIISASHQ